MPLLSVKLFAMQKASHHADTQHHSVIPLCPNMPTNTNCVHCVLCPHVVHMLTVTNSLHKQNRQNCLDKHHQYLQMQNRSVLIAAKNLHNIPGTVSTNTTQIQHDVHNHCLPVPILEDSSSSDLETTSRTMPNFSSLNTA
jgi:hypothetical protein